MKSKTPLTALVTLAAVGAGALWLSGQNAKAGASARATPPEPAAKPAQPATRPAGLTPAERVERGKHLVLTSGCHDCHTPWKLGANGPEPDMTRALSGHPELMKLPPAPPPSGPWIVSIAATNTAYAGPWGVSFTANLTPDKETGTGNWTEDDFVKTIRTGRHLGRGRRILPPMPIPVYQNFSDDELAAIFSYLKTITPLRNRVPTPLPPAAPESKHG